MIKPTEREWEIIMRITRIASEYFSIGNDDVISGVRKKNVFIARNFIYYILHVDYNISIGKLAFAFYRKDRSVKKQISCSKFCINNDSTQRKNYEELQEIIKKAYPK